MKAPAVCVTLCVLWGETGEDPARYANASVEQLAECLTEDQKLAEKKLPLGESGTSRAILAFARRLKEIDETALVHPENLWSVTIEEMRRG